MSNILIIDITNRKDILDFVLIQCDILECYIKNYSSLKEGSVEILNIYCDPLWEENGPIEYIDLESWGLN